MFAFSCGKVAVVAQPTVNANRAMTPIVVNEVHICFIFVPLLMILICRFRRPLEPRRPTDSPFGLRGTMPREEIVRPAGVYVYWTLVVLRLGSASRANAPQRNRDPNTF